MVRRALSAKRTDGTGGGLGVLVRVLAPILSFTCEEVWQFMPSSMRDAKSVHLTDWPSVSVPAEEAAALLGEYATVLDARDGHQGARGSLQRWRDRQEPRPRCG
jgi:isoleucyl-tRNA synthetase